MENKPHLFVTHTPSRLHSLHWIDNVGRAINTYRRDSGVLVFSMVDTYQSVTVHFHTRISFALGDVATGNELINTTFI